MVGERTVIKVYGRTYSNVRGSGPCYLEIPGRKTILFVTGREGSATVHLVNLATHKERHFPAYDSGIGDCISSPDPDNLQYEKVESVVGDTVAISALALNKSRHKCFIDLRESKFIREERDYEGYDRKWHHCVFEGGKANWTDVNQPAAPPAVEDHSK